MAVMIKCTKCQQKVSASKERYQQLVKKAGSEDNLIKTYICRNCKKAIRTALKR